MAYNVAQAQVEYQFENNCLSPMSLATAQIVEAKETLRARRRGAKPFTSTLHDNTNAKYSWLLPGWIIEERSGKPWTKKHEVIDNRSRMDITLIED
ncbi:hypothetical protein D8674_001166 [Pyrus ussuriensis x Pyrus communis]|uniref:Uncharacterized protein n=1 Tax=Pyrus ussuriensis x Pyrus communis TaxID=2448454 RepID=A0A5N5F5H0_9ROSA|nr:hypothetical protein D8674_001166 [Pyrus ussuriensis x Pyrus communis]